jgi:DNA-binding CsgD family transcriptional regulator
MLMLTGQSNPTAGHALQFAKGLLDASATAFYKVDDDLNLNDFVLCGVPIDFHQQYIDRMSWFDPLHPRHADDRPVARLADAVEQQLTADVATYRVFSSEFGISDMVEFFFRRQDKIVAGMSVAWGHHCRIPDGAMQTARKIHSYLEFNLVGNAAVPVGEVRYGLTAREQDVVSLLCCGRTNREIGEGLNISMSTVKTHLMHIFEKLGVETRSAAVALMSRLH